MRFVRATTTFVPVMFVTTFTTCVCTVARRNVTVTLNGPSATLLSSGVTFKMVLAAPAGMVTSASGSWFTPLTAVPLRT